ncbi:hypothetical protein ACIOFV_45905 [Streptomyces mirabilis]|uniref:hypothetical protein n=1 Tax=Streptomyces mirabilis TaxID=68239 RepID=UPI000ADD20DA
MAQEAEESVMLTGVRMTAGVVHVGETARRPATPAAGFVADPIDAILERQSRNARFWAEWFPLRDGFGERLPHRLGRHPLIFVGC